MWPLQVSPRLQGTFFACNFPLYPENFAQGKPVWGDPSLFELLMQPILFFFSFGPLQGLKDNLQSPLTV